MRINLQRTLMNMKNTIKLTKKSDKDVYVQHLTLVLFVIGVVGALGFGIQFVFSVLTVGR